MRRLLFAVAVVIAPVSSYSVYMMPEAMFFFGSWLLAYLLVVKLPANVIYGGIYVGFAVAALSAIKPHGLVVAATIPAMFAVLYFGRLQGILMDPNCWRRESDVLRHSWSGGLPSSSSRTAISRFRFLVSRSTSLP